MNEWKPIMSENVWTSWSRITTKTWEESALNLIQSKIQSAGVIWNLNVILSLPCLWNNFEFDHFQFICSWRWAELYLKMADTVSSVETHYRFLEESHRITSVCTKICSIISLCWLKTEYIIWMFFHAGLDVVKWLCVHLLYDWWAINPCRESILVGAKLYKTHFSP